MKGVTYRKKFGPFYYKICAEKSREIALAVRCFNPDFTSLTYEGEGKSSNPIHPGIAFAVVQDAVETALSWEKLPALRSTLRCTGHSITYHRHFADGEVLKIVSEIKEVTQSSGKVNVAIGVRVRKASDNRLILSGVWRYESLQ